MKFKIMKYNLINYKQIINFRKVNKTMFRQKNNSSYKFYNNNKKSKLFL